MTTQERSVTVKLRMAVREYITGGQQAVAMNKQLQASQEALGASARSASKDVDALSRSTEQHGRRIGRGTLYGAAGIAALGASGGALKALPPLLAAVATGAAAVPVSVLGAASGIGVAVVATRNLGDAIKELNKNSKQSPFAKLAPEARQFVNEIARSRTQLSGIQRELQGRFFTGTAAGLNLLVTKSLPQVTDGLEKIADDWSELFAEMALASAQPEVIGAFNGITASADRFFDGVTDRVRPTAAAIATLVTSTDPVARAFGDELLSWVDRFNAKVAEAKANGSLQQLFESGADAARELMSITQSVVSITGMVVREASASNDATAQAGESLRAYIDSGRAAGDVAGIVHTLTTAWEGLRDVLGPIGELVRNALADPGTAQSVATFFQLLSAGSQTVATLLQVILDLNNLTGGTLLALVGLAIAAGKLTTAITLTTTAATRGATALTNYGTAGARASGMLTGLIGVVGKTAGAFLGLELAHQVFDAFQNSAANVEALDASLRRLAESGVYAGEVGRIFDKGWGDIEAQANVASADGWFAGMLRGLEKAVPLTGDLAELLGSPTFSNSEANFKALDAAIVRYAQDTGDLEGTTRIWNEVMQRSNTDILTLQKLLPGAYGQLEQMQVAAHQAASGQSQLAERTKLLKAPIDEAVTAGRDLLGVFEELNGGSISFAKAEIGAEKAARAFKEALKENGDSFDVHTKKGLANKEAMIAYTEAAAKAAQAKMDETGSVQAAAGVYDGYIERLRTSLAQEGLKPAAIDAIIGKYAAMPASLEAAGGAVNNLNSKLNSIPKGMTFRFNGESIVNGLGQTIELANGVKGIPLGKKFTWDGKSLVDGKGKAYAAKQAVEAIPDRKKTDLRLQYGPFMSDVARAKAALRSIPDEDVRVVVRLTGASVSQAKANLQKAYANADGGVYVPRQRGGVTVAAAGGLLQPMIAPPGTRYQWAEPETGGELFLPRRGINRRRGRELLEVGADWYGMDVVPRRHGGITLAAASGLVNVAPQETTTTAPVRATRLDYAEAYLQARDAVKALSTSLKENGKSFSTATAKGRENRSAVYAGIRAAQEAARTKFEETGSVTQANKAYDQHIARLKAILKQQKVNAATIKSLLSLAQRPTYDVEKPAPKPPTNSLGNIGFAKAWIATLGGLEELRDQLSLNQVGVNTGTDYGRENLGNIIAFIETAAAMAQARYEQTKNAKSATGEYEKQIQALRDLLRQQGYPKATIDSLISQYGRITLVPNLRGGAYMAAGGLATLDRAQLFPGTGTAMYGFAEPGTGGELFVPRHGDRQRGRDLLAIGAGWYGGRVSFGGNSTSTMSYDYSTHLTVNARQYTPSMAELTGHQREIDARGRVGRPR